VAPRVGPLALKAENLEPPNLEPVNL
jgi:hypothetical protein